MSHTLSQPEEIEHTLLEMAQNGMEMDRPISNRKLSRDTLLDSWSGRYISPYRAAFERSGGGFLISANGCMALEEEPFKGGRL